MNDEGAPRGRCDAMVIAARAHTLEPMLRERLVREIAAPLRLEPSRTRFLTIDAAEGPREVPHAEVERVAEALLAAAPALILTAGETAFRALAALRSWRPKHRAVHYTELYGLRYGTSGSLQVGRRAARWIPLVHPNTLKPFRVRAPADRQPCAAGWSLLHSRWKHDHLDGVRALPPMHLRTRPLGAHLPEGRGRRLRIARAEIFEQPGFGKTLEVVFVGVESRNRDDVARGSFPLGGPGLAVLVEAALGERLEAVDDALVARLLNERVIADTFHGAAGKQIAWVRNLRAWSPAQRSSAREVLHESQGKEDEPDRAEPEADEEEAPLLG